MTFRETSPTLLPLALKPVVPPTWLMFPTASTTDASQIAEERTSLKSTVNFQDMAYMGSSLWAWQAGYSMLVSSCAFGKQWKQSSSFAFPASPSLNLHLTEKETKGFVKGSSVTISPIGHATAWFRLRVISAAWNQTQMQDARGERGEICSISQEMLESSKKGARWW